MGPARRFCASALAAALVAGCMTDSGEYDAKVSEKYPIPDGASPQCVAAAKRASRFCVGPIPVTDDYKTFECNNAQWDYHRNCR